MTIFAILILKENFVLWLNIFLVTSTNWVNLIDRYNLCYQQP